MFENYGRTAMPFGLGTNSWAMSWVHGREGGREGGREEARTTQTKHKRYLATM